MKRSSPTPAASSKLLTIRPADESTQDAQDRVDSAKDQSDLATLEQRKAEERASDKIGSIVDHAPYVMDQSPTQVFGMALINSYKGDAGKIPNWLFKRWYFRDNIIIDFFSSKRAYEDAEVEARRKMAHKFKFKYAALGPTMSYRTDLPEQLGV